MILIQKGAVPVDFNCDKVSVVHEPNETGSLESKIRKAFNGSPLSTKELLAKLNLNWTTQKLNSYLKKLDFI